MYKKLPFCIFAVLLVCFASTLAFAEGYKKDISTTIVDLPVNFKNVKTIRTVDLRSTVVREDIGIRAENIDNQPQNEYYVPLPEEYDNKVAHFTAALKTASKEALPVEKIGFDSTRKIQIYKITFPEPVEAGSTVAFGIKFVTTKSLVPNPPAIPQVARQHVEYNNNMFIYSLYLTEDSKTTVVLPPNGNVVTFTETTEAFSRSGNKLIYGPYHHIDPLVYSEMHIHYEQSQPILTVTNLVRDIHVSHLGGNMAVEERYPLRHDGARLDKQFSRVEFQQSAGVHDHTNVLKQLTFRLPASARNVYYRDDIGNVSTSRLRNEVTSTVLELTPRYPLFGGWNYTWFHGYNADLGEFLHYNKRAGRYILNLRLVENAKRMSFEHVKLNVVLPEGAADVQVEAPFEFDGITHGKHYTNLDTTGRYLLTLDKSNVVFEHEQFVQVQSKLI
ncbi:Ribophorin I [Umbelopsis sp. PMI_123]|nr:Ribophorin I [Umbelopsis sp. PMI_123]